MLLPWHNSTGELYSILHPAHPMERGVVWSWNVGVNIVGFGQFEEYPACESHTFNASSKLIFSFHHRNGFMAAYCEYNPDIARVMRSQGLAMHVYTTKYIGHYYELLSNIANSLLK